MLKITVKIDGMMCGMCESHMMASKLATLAISSIHNGLELWILDFLLFYAVFYVRSRFG